MAFNHQKSAWQVGAKRPATSSEARNRRALYVSQTKVGRSSIDAFSLPGTPTTWDKPPLEQLKEDEVERIEMKERSGVNVQKTEPVVNILKLEEEIPKPIEVNVIERVTTPKESTEVTSSEPKTTAKSPTRLTIPIGGVSKEPRVSMISIDSSSQRRRGVHFDNLPDWGESSSSRPVSAIKPQTKFKTIAKSLSVLSRAGIIEAIKPEMSREQFAFLNKYGMSMDQIAEQAVQKFEGPRWKYILTKFILDPSSDFFYYWSIIAANAYLYNLLIVVYRCVFFQGIRVEWFWHVLLIVLDIFTDIIYATDMFFRSRTGFLEQGLLVRDIRKTWRRYRKSAQLKWDIVSILPFDYVFELFFWTTNPVLRFNRLFRLDRFNYAINTTETRISIPNAFRVSCVVLYILILIHWNACAYFFVSNLIGLHADSWVYGAKNIQSLPPNVPDSISRRYVYSFYWSTLMLTTVGEVPWPILSSEFIFVTADLMFGVLIFATIVGNVGSMIQNVSQQRSEFQNRVDGIKKYMDMRNIGTELKSRVLKWFDYLWSNKQTVNDQEILNVLPTKLQAEIAMHVHFETLRKVRIFQDCEAGLLAELVLKLQLQVFSPRDYVCRKGDIGREMYIVKKGRLQVVGDDGCTVLHTLQEGAVFGELSILNIAGSKQGNRRSASIRSVGYTDLFVLKKTDLWDALREYPDARKVLIQKGREILQKDNLLDENAPMENKTSEEIAIALQDHVSYLQTRLARLTAEHISNETKLKARLEYLENQLRRHGDEGFYDEYDKIKNE